MNPVYVAVISGLVLGLIVISPLAYVLVQDDPKIITESKILDLIDDKISEIPPAVNEYKLRFNAEDIEWLNKNYISENEQNITGNSTAKSIEKLTLQQEQFSKQMALIDAKIANIRHSPTAQNTIATCQSNDFALRTATPNQTFTNTFERGEIVYITGESARSTNLNIKIVFMDKQDSTVQQDNFNSSTTGVFTRAWITDNNTPLGDYRVELTGANKKDCTVITIE